MGRGRLSGRKDRILLVFPLSPEISRVLDGSVRVLTHPWFPLEASPGAARAPRAWVSELDRLDSNPSLNTIESLAFAPHSTFL